MATPGRDRAVALSLQLAQAHQELRRQLAALRAHPGERHPGNGALTTHCLAFCTSLTAHHRGEDTGMFTDLLRERPDLADTVRNLVQDHEMIATILTRVADLAAGAAASANRHTISAELDGLAAIMESHFRYEERAISNALDQGTADTGWSAQVFRFDPASRAAPNS